MGVMGPVKQAYMHQIIPSKQRATVISFDSMFGSGGSVIGQAGLGYLARTRSIADGYVIGGLATLLALPVLGLLRRLGGREDVIIGDAGQQGVCAGQGLPEITSVDSTRRTSELEA
jgi:MFS family permease